jgi:hypothetical protein
MQVRRVAAVVTLPDAVATFELFVCHIDNIAEKVL